MPVSIFPVVDGVSYSMKFYLLFLGLYVLAGAE